MRIEFSQKGTLSNVKAYSGYVETKSGKNLAFAVIANNFNCSKSQIVKKMEFIFNAMVLLSSRMTILQNSLSSIPSIFNICGTILAPENPNSIDFNTYGVDSTKI